LYGIGQVFQRVTIESLPDNVLLDIFDFYQVAIDKDGCEYPWNWEKLVHVCQRWRYIIFESPIRLNLQLFCTENSPVRKLLDFWPPFPLVIRFIGYPWKKKPKDCIDSTDNIIAALERRDRVRVIQVHLDITSNRLFERVFAAMEETFPVLRSLSFELGGEILPEQITLLNGSAPSLRDLTLRGISFPPLPQLLSSTSDLTSLRLFDIPNSGYIPPETMATSLSALPKLESLSITFKSPTPRLELRNRSPLLQTRFVLPALTRLEFEGVSEYFEVLAAQFDAPLLDDFTISYFYQPILDIPQTVRFFSSYLDSLKPYSITLTFILWDGVFITFPSNTTHHSTLFPSHLWKIMCRHPNRQITSVAQICGQIPPFRSSVKSLAIMCDVLIDPNPTLWLQLFHTFPSVQNLQIPVALEPAIVSAFDRPTEGSLAVAEVFPSLHNLSIMGNKSGETVQRPIQSFVADRQRSGRPVTVFRVDSNGRTRVGTSS
jgi:hypothetical protein